MNTKNWKNDWHEYLPSHFEWLEKLPITASTSFEPHQTYLVATKPDKDTWQLDATALSADIQAEVKACAETAGWKGKGTFTCSAREANWILVPLSGLEVTSAQKARQLGIDGASFSKSLNVQTLVLCSGKDHSALDILDGYCQSTYSLKTFKGAKQKDKAKEQTLPKALRLLDGATTSDGIESARAFGQALTITKWLEDAPPNWLTPERFAEVAAGLCKDIGIQCTVRGREEIESLGMGCFASVACGTKLDPKFILCEIPGEDTSKTIALVGKGLTFDSGGISLKPSAGMGEMKYDMCGGASVLGATYFLGKNKPKTNVITMIGAVENMPGEQATRPSDIVTSYDQQTVEVLNTDAEGRLVLCDLLAYATKNYKPALIVDVATLTGAVVVALGAFGAAIVSNKQHVAEYVVGIGKKVGEPAWQLPLWPELAKELRSEIADLKNIPAASVKAGTVTAAQFLREFIGDANWAHVDIAGTGWNCKATGYPSGGGSGYGVRLLSQICLQYEPLS